MKADQTYRFEEGSLHNLVYLPNNVRHLFDNPLQYHWNYPTDFSKCLIPNVNVIILKTTVVELFGNMLSISFP